MARPMSSNGPDLPNAKSPRFPINFRLLLPRSVPPYAFARPLVAQAATDGFEQDAERLLAAMRAVATLVNRPSQLLEDWAALSGVLGGRLQHGDDWRPDGSTSIRVPLLGQQVTVTPTVTRIGWRGRRLVTRVASEREVAHSERYVMAHREHSIDRGSRRGLSLVDDLWSSLAEYRVYARSPNCVPGGLTSAVAEAIAAAAPKIVTGRRTLVTMDLDGNVTNTERLLAAASAVAQLAKSDARKLEPYR